MRVDVVRHCPEILTGTAMWSDDDFRAGKRGLIGGDDETNGLSPGVMSAKLTGEPGAFCGIALVVAVGLEDGVADGGRVRRIEGVGVGAEGLVGAEAAADGEGAVGQGGFGPAGGR